MSTGLQLRARLDPVALLFERVRGQGNTADGAGAMKFLPVQIDSGAPGLSERLQERLQVGNLLVGMPQGRESGLSFGRAYELARQRCERAAGTEFEKDPVRSFGKRGDVVGYFISGAKERNPAAAQALIEKLKRGRK